MQKPLRFWGLLLGIISAGSLATWGLLLVLGSFNQTASALPATTTTTDPLPVTTAAAETTTPLGGTLESVAPIDPGAKADSQDPPATTVAKVGPTAGPVSAAKPVVPEEPVGGTAVPADWAKAPELLTSVTEGFNGFPGIWSVAVIDLTTGSRWSLRGAVRYHPASTIKLPVALFAMTEQKAGRLKWSDVIQYTEADFESPGGGAFESAPFGGWYPVENLVNRSLIYSNNVAVNMLGRHLQWQRIRDWSKTIDGELFREEDASPSTTALNELNWWRYLYQVSLDDPQTAALVLDPLSQVQYDGRIAAGLPPGVKFVHKFGSYDGNFHDGGIVWAGGAPYALVIMTNGAEVDVADTYIPLATAAIHKAMSH